MKDGRKNNGRAKGPLLTPEPLTKALLSKVMNASHSEVAAMAGCSTYTISDAWAGRRHGLALHTLHRLADSLGYEIVLQPKSDLFNSCPRCERKDREAGALADKLTWSGA